MSRIEPSMSPDTAFFWEGVAQGRLLVQRCGGCDALRHPPRPMCPACNSLAWDPYETTGRGQVYSFVMPRHPRYPGFDDPHIAVLVELEEGLRLVSNLGEVEPEDVTIGMPVEVFYATFEGGIVLPQFRPAAPA